MTVRLSRRARKDLDDIRNYTIDRWGRDQWLKYYRDLASSFERITNDPLIGRSRELFGDNMRSLPCGKHLIFFAPIEALNGAPVILRIVHQSRYLPALSYYDDLDSI
ncbi:type II toxin-antitoxin system RelE/ParE family toxin [Nioella sp. MMSF_3534]|uniref:type II toxin-antitoxin system RelE/ParE family toxin n=1 Tax=Nioella sp. MMSF_3534 TaxID=3046720 RepID=UPI0027400899|nr:type II toxin-antitoxin system RelE/ParE family toxin [Nioella sp. MMSF_3534]